MARPFQFHLATLLWLMLVVAALLSIARFIHPLLALFVGVPMFASLTVRQFNTAVILGAVAGAGTLCLTAGVAFVYFSPHAPFGAWLFCELTALCFFGLAGGGIVGAIFWFGRFLTGHLGEYGPHDPPLLSTLDGQFMMLGVVFLLVCCSIHVTPMVIPFAVFFVLIVVLAIVQSK
jgi:hypothetical protein